MRRVFAPGHRRSLWRCFGDLFRSPCIRQEKPLPSDPRISVCGCALPNPDLAPLGPGDVSREAVSGQPQPRRRPQLRPAAFSAQRGVSQPATGSQPGGCKGPFEAKRRPPQRRQRRSSARACAGPAGSGETTAVWGVEPGGSAAPGGPGGARERRGGEWRPGPAGMPSADPAWEQG